jgi:hypothetical protein
VANDAVDVGWRLDRLLALISAALLLQMIMLATMGIETKQRSLEELADQST